MMTEASRLKSLLGLLAGVVLVVSFVGAAQMMRSPSIESTPDPQTSQILDAGCTGQRRFSGKPA